MLKLTKRNPKSQTKEIAKFLKDNIGELDTITKLKLNALNTWLEVEEKAREQLTKEGLLTTYNKGTSIGIHPYFKVLADAHKFIIKYLRELGIKNAEVESGDDYDPFKELLEENN